MTKSFEHHLIRMSQKFYYILVYATLQHVYPMTKAVQAMACTFCGW